MLDFQLSDEQRAWQKVARDFSENEIRPIAEKLDRSENLVADFPWDMIRKASKAGLRTVSLPRQYGGPQLDMLTWLVIIEELGAVDIACAKIFSQCWKLVRAIAGRGTQDQKDRFLTAFRDDDTYLLTAGRTEPGAGSDNHLPYEEPSAGVKLTAERRGDHYVLNGRKHFVSHAPVSKLLIIAARTDKTVGTTAGTSSFLLTRGTPGLTFGQAHDKVGFRIYLQGEINCDNVVVPIENLLGGKEGPAVYEVVVRNIELAVYAVVVARAALDAAVRHATESGNKAAVSALLGELHQEVEAARAFLWRATWLAEHKVQDRSLTMSAKVFCTEMAVRVCVRALEICGGEALLRETPVQKYVRDALALPHMDATNPINKLKIAKFMHTWIGEGRLPSWGRSTASMGVR